MFKITDKALAKTPARKRRPKQPVTVTEPHPLAREEALRLADGDTSRLTYYRDGSIVVGNEKHDQSHPTAG